MKNKGKAMIAVLALTITAIVATVAAASDAEEKAVSEAAEQFYLALNAMFAGEVSPMTEVWSHGTQTT